MKFGVTIPTYGRWGDPAVIRDGVQAAEDLGFDTVWFGDHVAPAFTDAGRAHDAVTFDPLWRDLR